MKIVRIAALGAALSLAACGGGSPEKLGEDFFSAIDKGNTGKALEMFGSDAADTPMGALLKEKLEESADKFAQRGGLKSVKCAAPEAELKAVREVGRGSVKLNCALEFGDGKSKTESLHTRLADGKWRMDIN